MRPLLRLATTAAAAGLILPLLPPLQASSSLRTASVRTASVPRGAARAGQIIVQIHRDAPAEADERIVRAAGGQRARKAALERRFLVELEPGTSIDEALARLRGRPEVEYAEPNGIMRAFLRPNDRFYFAQWHWQKLRAERTWEIQRGAPTVAVAVLDSGIAYEDFGPFRKAPDFDRTHFLPGYNVFDGSSHANDDNFHGTHVASVIAESTNNSEGAAGFAFEAALMPVKVLDREGFGDFFGVAEGIDFAVNFTQGGERPVKVINLSLGGDSPSQTVQRAIDRAVAAGVVVVAAAGNDGIGSVSYPAAYDNVIAVGALDGRNERAPYSNFGSALDVMAYGGDLDRDDAGENGRPDGFPDGILQQTFDPDRALEEGVYDDFGYYFVVGTSQATPQVAALAALLIHQGITDPQAVKAAIESTAQDLGAPGRDDQFGHGVIRPVEALSGLGLGVQE